MYFAVKIVAIACLAAASCVTCSSARRSATNQFLVPSESQNVPAQASQNDQAARQAQQAKLHYMEIGPSLKGDYKFGYDTGSGPAGQSFREETRLDDGTVKGAYGYVDANGKQRIVKYSAGKAGFVVESDQEAGKQGAGNQAAAAPAQAPSAPHRPTPVALPQQQHHHHQHQAPVRQAPAPIAPQQPQQPQQQAGNQINFDEPQQPTLSRQQAEAQHAQQLRQHQIAQQHALAQQQQLAQQQEQQQQLLIQQQQQQLAAQQQQQQQHQAPAAAQPQFSGHQQQQQAPVAQPQFAAPQQQRHHQHHQLQQPQPQPLSQPQQGPAPIVHQFNQNGHFFAQSNDANLGQLLAQQLQQLQAQQQQHAQHQQPQFQAPQQQPDFSASAAPAPTPQRFAAPQQQQAQNFNQDFNGDFAHPVRASRHAHFQQDQAAAQAPVAARNVASPQSALLALHQQQQHDAQILANLRAQQLEQQQRQQSAAAASAPAAPQQHHHQQQQAPQQFQQQQSAPLQQFVPQRHAAQSQQVARNAPIAPQQQQLAAGPISETPAAVQPEVFGPPVIDIRTLNYSIGQQTRVH